MPKALTSAQLEQRAKAHVDHGLYAKSGSALKLRSKKVRNLCVKARRLMPWLSASDEPALRGWAELEVLGASVFIDLVTKGATNAKGDPRRLLTEWRLLKQSQLAYETALGMTPAARAALGVKVAIGRQADAATELARLRAESERRDT